MITRFNGRLREKMQKRHPFEVSFFKYIITNKIQSKGDFYHEKTRNQTSIKKPFRRI